MEKNKWIAEQGNCSAEDLLLVLNKIDINKTKYIAMYVDAFDAGYGAGLKAENLSRLLEVRIFNEETELLATRGSIAEAFSWRITCDKELDTDEYLVSNHFIDINMEHSKPLGDGLMELLSTVGGKYVLPIADTMERIKVKSYISYDANGMAKIVDSRICSFW